MKRLRKACLRFCVLALPLAVIAPIFAQTAKCPPDAELRRIVVTVGIDHYEHGAKWPILKSAVNDANSLQQVLESKFGYQSYESLAKTEPLREGKATRDAINTLVEDALPGILCNKDDFILFFSGHGDSRPYQNGDIKGVSGYLVPFDAKEQGVSSLIDVKEFLENVSHLPARHILVILDACHSGIAVKDAQQGLKTSQDYQAALELRNSRKVIVSAQPDQTASDSGSIPGHSLFGGLLWQGLDQGLVFKSESFIADSQLTDFLRESVASESNRKQLPDGAPFIGNDGGSLVLKLGQDLAGLYRNAMQNLMNGDYDDFRLNATRAAQRNPDDPLTLALQYRLAIRQGNTDAAKSSIEKLWELAKVQTQPTSTPLNRRELLGIRHQLTFWSNALQLPVREAPPAADIHVSTGETEQHLLPLSGSNEFRVHAEANLYFKLRARAAETYVYVFLIDRVGRFQSPGFLSQGQNPVDSKSERLSMMQSGPEPDDMQEWHFIFSEHPIDEFLSPPSDTSKGGSPAVAAELAGATHYVVTIRPEE